MLSGACLCGAVSLEISELDHQPEACHCSLCRKQSGHFLAAVNVRRSALKIEGDEHITWYRSSEKVQRGFCSTCGSTLFWQPVMNGYEFTAVAKGLFDGPTNLRLSKHAFVGGKGDYYEVSDGVAKGES